MLHGRADYNERIQDSAGIIPIDEPVFLIRGQDSAAYDTLISYARHAEGKGADLEFCQLVRGWAERMRAWQQQNGSKLPDMPAPGDDGKVRRES